MAEPYNSAKKKAWRPVELIPLAEAVFCGNCEVFSAGKNGHCLGCGSASVVNASRLLSGWRKPAIVEFEFDAGRAPGGRFL